MLNHTHFVLHKPFGYLSQLVTNQRKVQGKKKLLSELFNFPQGVMSIGRLDEKSEGLLLLTTDGVLSEKIRSRKVEKEYWVQLDGEITEEAIQLLEQGVEIGFEGKRYTTLPCGAQILKSSPSVSPTPQGIRENRHRPSSWISITITEGKFRQVRKMTAAVGFPTLRLIRVRIGEIHLGDLLPGKCREMPNLDQALCLPG